MYVVTNTTTNETPVRFAIIDTRTGNQVGSLYTNRKRAVSRADKLDNAYGAYRYTVRTIEENV